MSSSEHPESRRFAFLYRNAIHPFIAVSVSFLLFITFILLTQQIIPYPLPPLFPGILLLITIENAVIGNIFYRERLGAGARIREVVVTLIILYTWTALFNTGTLTEKFTFRVTVVIPLLFGALAWFFTGMVHTRLRSREDFIAIIENKQGEELQKVIRDYQQFAISTIQDLKGLKTLLLFCEIFLGILLFTFSLLGQIPGLPALAAFIAFTLLLFHPVRSSQFLHWRICVLRRWNSN